MIRNVRAVFGVLLAYLLVWRSVIFPPLNISKAIFRSLWFSCPHPVHKAYSSIVYACEISLMERWDSSLSAAYRQDARNCRPLGISGFSFYCGGVVESDCFAQQYGCNIGL